MGGICPLSRAKVDLRTLDIPDAASPCPTFVLTDPINSFVSGVRLNTRDNASTSIPSPTLSRY